MPHDQISRSLDPSSCEIDDLAPPLAVLIIELLELLRTHGHGLAARLREASDKIRIAECFGHGLVERHDDVRWRAPWGDDAVPYHCLEARHGLGDRRDLRHRA